MKKSEIGYHAILIAILVMFLLPFVYLLLTAFQPVGFSASHVIHAFTLSNFESIFDEPMFITSFVNTLLITGVSVAIALGMGVSASYAISRYEIKFKESIFFILLTTRMGPAVGFAIPFYFMLSSFGLIDTKPGIILMYIVIILSFSVWLMRGFFESAPVELEEAALIDGYSRWGAFKKIVLPLIFSGIAITAVFCFLFLWNEYFYNVILAREAARTLTQQVSGYAAGIKVEFEKVAAAGVLSVIPVLIILIVLGKKLIKGFALGMIK